MKYIWLYFLISAIVIIPGLFSLFKWGLRPGIDFTGGAVLEYRIKKNDSFGMQELRIKERFEEIINKENIKLSSISHSADNIVILKTKTIDQKQEKKLQEKIKEEFKDAEQLRFETVGPILGQELIRKTIIAVILATSFILFYIAWQFKDKRFGVCATLATFHDSLVILGIFSLLGHFKEVEIDTLFVTAVLTSLSFSVHDTVVVYDRIRESLKNFPKANFVDLVNKAITETMTRSLNNSLTIIFMLLVLWLIGGQSIKWFVFALLIGTISGTYSSPFVATPLLVVWKQIQERRKKL